MITLTDILSKIDSLPPMPAIAMQLMEAAQDPDVDMNTVAEWISKDPGMTASILKLCNSSFYGFPKKVSSLNQAVSIFGLNKITQLAIAALSSRYLVGKTGGYDLETGELWKHSIVAASAAEKIAVKCGYGDVGLAFTAGLLQDVGKIIIHEYVGEKLQEITDLAEKDKRGFLAAEKQMLGFSHADAGALLMERWNFPAALVDSVRHHHESSKAEVDITLARISQLADATTMIMGLGLGADGLCYNLPEEILTALGLNQDRAFQEVLIHLAARIREDPDALHPPRA